MNSPKLNQFNTLNFDVVGTLIDFESRILEWFRSKLAERSFEASVDAWALEYMSETIDDPFDVKITCDEVGLNKPSSRVFDYLLQKLAPHGIVKTDSLHTAQNQYHDIIPAMALGFSTM